MRALPKKKKNQTHWMLISVGVVFLIIVGIAGYLTYRFAHDPIKVDWSSDTPDETPQCGAAATQLALGSPYRGVNSPASYFTTDGSDIFISARHFEHGGFLDSETGVASIWIGDAATPPTYDEQSGQVANTKVSVPVREGKHKRIQLPKGRYWLWTSIGGDVVVASCGILSGQQPGGETAPTIPSVGHGGACDDQSYYTEHTKECAVE